MEQKESFSYTYSAPVNQEVLSIRKQYLHREETKLEELKRLDRLVQNSGVIESLSAGMVGCLIFGLGLCLTMQVIGNAVWLGIVFGLIGAVGMIFAYPIKQKVYSKTKAEHISRILELTIELTGNV